MKNTVVYYPKHTRLKYLTNYVTPHSRIHFYKLTRPWSRDSRIIVFKKPTTFPFQEPDDIITQLHHVYLRSI